MLKIIKTPLQLILVLSLLFFSACSSIGNPTYGPVQENNFQDIYLEKFSNDSQEVIFYSRAIWYPNKNGFKFLPAGKKSQKGLLMLTDQNLLFLEWENNQYATLFSTHYTEISELRLAANDLFGRVVIKNQAYNSFEILGISGPELPDKEQTDVVYQIILKQKAQ